MAHRRQQIREATVAALKGKTAAVDRVSKTRAVPYRLNELPAVSVYTVEEEVVPRLPDLGRTVTLAIVGVVSLTLAHPNVDDELDALALEIETAMNADPTLGGAATLTYLVATAIDVVDEQGRPVGGIRLTYHAKYTTSTKK